MSTAACARKTPWEFRLRALVIGCAFGAGFGLGTALQFALFGAAQPSFVVVGERSGALGVAVAAWCAAALTIAAWLVRWWASSYHARGVVMNRDVLTGRLTAEGPYRHVRNPLYFGNLLVALGIGLLGPPIATLLVVLFNLAFVYRLIFIEEHYLRDAWGEAYESYCRRVPRLLPRLRPIQGPVIPGGSATPNFRSGFVTELYSLGFACATVAVAVAFSIGKTAHWWEAFWFIIACGIAVSLMVRAEDKTGA